MIPAGIHPDVYADSVLFPFNLKLEPINRQQGVPNEIWRNLDRGVEFVGVITNQPSGIIEAYATERQYYPNGN